MNSFERAEWIWAANADGVYGAQADEYAEFLEEVEYSGRRAVLNISADSNYAVYINGALAAFGQYPDFPYDKVYDEIDVSRHMRQGKNIIGIRVWYYGISTTQTYYPGKAGVIYSLFADGVHLVSSTEASLSRLSPGYMQHKGRIITNQLGLSFGYDARCADGWLLGEPSLEFGFSPSVLIGESYPLRLRSCKRTELGRTFEGRALRDDEATPVSKNGVIFDLGSEAVGFVCLDFVSSSTAPVTVAFGEHIVDGHVRQLVGGRDFSFTYIPTEGRNYYMNPYRRIGCRYIELIPEGEISDAAVSLRQVVYPVQMKDAPKSLTPIQKKIYDACVYTLICCMHEHYEDCPWREQALYTMDSRNQMLAGYYAFGEYTFPRANLELIAADNRADGILSICYPMRSDGTAIPSFSLHFITECEEYLRYSGDLEFIRGIYPKLRSVLHTFLSKIDDNGLVAPLAGEGMWNFYEWREGLDGENQLSYRYTPEGLEPDIILNCLLSIATSRMAKIESELGISSDSEERALALNAAINAWFLDTEAGVYRNRKSEPYASKLGNALAVLAGAAEGELRVGIAKKLSEDNELIPASLSMKGFVYDALIDVDKQGYADYILDTIEKTYTPMVELENGTVWETELGESDFHNAGSLCHGWSAIPIYYYHVLLGDKNGKA